MLNISTNSFSSLEWRITVIMSGINLQFDGRKYPLTELAIITSTIETMKYSVVSEGEGRIPKRQSRRMEI